MKIYMKLILQVVDWPCSIGVFKEGGNEGNLQESEVGQMQTSTQDEARSHHQPVSKAT